MKTNTLNPTRWHKLLLFACLMALPDLSFAQPSGHYVPGVEGIKAASLPPPGFYARDYNYFYNSHRLNDGNGNASPPPDFDVFTYANVPRAIWITDLKVLGAYVGVDTLLPLVYQNVTAGGTKSENFGAGDLFAEGTLSWHPKQFDLAFGTGVWMPTGNSGSLTDAGLGYWTVMFTAGATWYIDAAKTWSISALNRYEFNSEQRDTDTFPGQVFTLEWGVGKTLLKVLDVGAAGYYQQQVTASSGQSSSSRSRAAAVGPEITYAFPKIMLFLSARYEYEFMAENRSQGQEVCFTLTKRF